jgi:hypothetical protein
MPTLGVTRTEDDFCQHIAQTIDSDRDAGWIFIVDNLNIHFSESLVRLVAERCNLVNELGVKGKSGILKSMRSRADFLSDETHRIRFVYLPKHTSWLNQIECWFSILVRRLLKRSSFDSTRELKQQILNFIDYFRRSVKKQPTLLGSSLSASSALRLAIIPIDRIIPAPGRSISASRRGMGIIGSRYGQLSRKASGVLPYRQCC